MRYNVDDDLHAKRMVIANIPELVDYRISIISFP